LLLNNRKVIFQTVFLAALMAIAACTQCSVSESPSGTAVSIRDGQISELTQQDLAEPHRALIDAAWQNDVTRAKALIEAGADVNYKDATLQSAYLIATSEGYRELLELTFRYGADVTSLDSFQGTGLIRSAERGHANVVGRLIQAGTDVDHVNRLGWTALHEAIILGNGSERYVDTVRILVAGGADVELPSASGNISPLNHAEANNQTAVGNTLRKALDSGTIENPDAALLAAALTGDADQLALALRAGADIELRDSQERTPLLLAVTGDNLEVARLLVALGADVDALDGRHDTPWLVTGVTGSVAMAEVLLLAIPGPDFTILNRFGGTSLIPAADRGHVEYVRRVSSTDIDIDHVNDLGWTALMEAVLLGDGSQRYQEIVAILLSAGADSSIGDRGGVLPLEHAAEMGYEAIVELLSAA
jgi:ankyrin repeat protein